MDGVGQLQHLIGLGCAEAGDALELDHRLGVGVGELVRDALAVGVAIADGLLAVVLFRASFGAKEEDRIRNGKEIWKILVDNVYSIGTVGQSPAFMGVRIVKNNMGNIPDRQVNAQHVRTPNTSHPSTFFFKA